MSQVYGNGHRMRLSISKAEKWDESDRLSLIRICENEGQWKLSVVLPAWDDTPATVEVRPPGLLIKSGPVSRWVPLPPDAFVERAIINVSDGDLTVAMPVRSARGRRNLVHVW